MRCHPLVSPTALAAVALILLTACPSRKPPPGEEQMPARFGREAPPVVEVPPLPRLPAPQPRPEALDELAEKLGGKVTVRYPAYDGDPFFVTFPVRQAATVSAAQALNDYVAPVLRAVGFDSEKVRLAATTETGAQMPRPDFAGLAAAVTEEYERREQMLRPRTREMLAVFTGDAPASPDVDMALEMGEGMSFRQFVGEIERLEIQYPFHQVVGDVPIEHTMVLAVRRDGESISSLRGSLLSRFEVVNPGERLAPAAVLEAARKQISELPGMELPRREQESAPALVLLAYGAASSGEPALRYAYRYDVTASYFGLEAPLLIWVDAVDGRLLKLVTLLADVSATGEAYDRDPGIGTAQLFFQVDGAVASQYRLQLAGAINRVDYQGAGYDALDVSILDTSGSSTPTFADFNQAPINDEAQALCSSGTNKGFQQVNYFSTISRYRSRGLSLGVFTPYPASPWNPVVEGRQCEGATDTATDRNGWTCRVDANCCDGANCGTCTAPHCNAWSSMFFGACGGYFAADCPDSSWLNFAHDNTMVGHELAHSLTSRFTCGRPTDWCGMAVCTLPVCWYRLHDLADFWADHLESTNCFAGWVAKNNAGTDLSLDCATHTEGGGLPRKHEVEVPFDQTDPMDHFPEHRSLASGGYADGQIGAAALWQVRLGMRSKCRPSGMPQFAVRFARALKNTGMYGSTPPRTDRGIYTFLYGLEQEMLEQWATSGDPGGPPAFAHNGRHTTNKLTAGFARAGLFLVPPACIDGDAATSDAGFCAAGDTGADAVIDIDDNDTGDDLEIHGVDHPEVDFLELGGAAPTFHVWTGPRYRFDSSACVGGGVLEGNACAAAADCACLPADSSCSADGVCQPDERASTTSTALCNTEFQVDVSTDSGFAAVSTISSPWTPVDTDPSTVATVECYGTWQPGPGDWTTLQAGGALSRIYYRARTRGPGGANPRLSTDPGNGMRTVTAPYAVLTSDGQSDY